MNILSIFADPLSGWYYFKLVLWSVYVCMLYLFLPWCCSCCSYCCWASLPQLCRRTAQWNCVEIRSSSGKRTQNVAAAQTQSTRYIHNPIHTHTHTQTHFLRHAHAAETPTQAGLQDFAHLKCIEIFQIVFKIELKFHSLPLFFFLSFSSYSCVCVKNFKCGVQRKLHKNIQVIYSSSSLWATMSGNYFLSDSFFVSEFLLQFN